MDHIHPGLTGEKTITVSEAQLATHLGSGSVEVFATPAMIALLAACRRGQTSPQARLMVN
jgi:fluoroacetyl-CoA thioesterase